MNATRILILSICLSINTAIVKSQDAITIENLQEFRYSFELKDGRMEGEGGDFLKNEIEAAQFTIIGDYANSRQVAEFNKWLLPFIDKHGYETMVLELGPVSGEILNQISSCNQSAVKSLNKLNNAYAFRESERIHFPIPILRSIEDAEMIDLAIAQEWNFIGIHNDSWNGLGMLLKETYLNLSEDRQIKIKEKYEQAANNLRQLYRQRSGDLLNFVEEFQKDPQIQDYLKICDVNPLNQAVLASIQQSLDKCKQYASRSYFEKNRDRIPVEKRLLRKALVANDFDLSEDKLLLKLNLRHASKGFQPDGFYGVANTLHEIASYHGKKAINIGMIRRFYLEDGQVKDELERDYYFRDRYTDLIQMGQQDEWTVIDLRPLMEGSYYSSSYVLSPWIKEMMKQYDLIVIPAMDSATTDNFEAIK